MTDVPNTLVLIGAPGSGKTSAGRALAQKLGVPFVDVDEQIVREQGKTISEIFADEGEQGFRDLEREATVRALSGPGVVSLGGGAVMTPAIQDALQAHTVIWLKVSVKKAARRVGLNTGRPLLAGDVRARLEELLAVRLPVYAALATVAVDTEMLTPRQTADAILELLGRSRA